MQPQRLGFAEFPSPIDTLMLVFAGEALVHLDFAGNDERMRTALARRHGDWRPEPSPLPEAIAAPIEAYFAGETRALADISYVTGGTPFQRTVWRALTAIAPGTTTSYAAIAAAVGKGVSACRAVGAAVGANPVSLVVPCHRVVGSDGRLTGYAGGLDRKRWLLHHEDAATAD